ncbi:YobA family protein [Paenibacillus alkaliterrae]|uniref:DUF3221 domain-containing protein n=1 Tax=Paenibacillus alkaliterrae TaxID=320909 RepID=UPI001F3A3E5F|nr:DUF3221 domain-containing protein [Paenibacillus alkaliterrae]MCF2939560.1 YobA family protein [Paenibacillus alkaliterrae]
MLKRIFQIFFCLLCLSGCGVSNEEPNKTIKSGEADLVGYVVKKKESQILVVSEFPNAKNKYESVWVSGSNIDDLDIGQKVEVFFDGTIQTSDPGQGTAGEITILKIQSPENTILSPKDALKKSLLQVENWEVPIVKEFSYHSKDQNWVIILYDAKNTYNGEKTILIEDK